MRRGRRTQWLLLPCPNSTPKLIFHAEAESRRT